MTTTREQKLTVAKIEDHEGDGVCGACERTGLRWIVTLSDGSQIGTECAKKLLGYTITRKTFDWIQDFELVAEKDYFQYHVCLYRHKNGNAARTTFNGTVQAVGGFAAMQREYDNCN